MLHIGCIHTFEKELVACVCFCYAVRLKKTSKRRKPPEHRISFKIAGHIASVHFVRKYVFILLLLLLIIIIIIIKVIIIISQCVIPVVH